MLNKAIRNNTKFQPRFLKAVDITPRDDAFHGSINLLDIEWWYFDAVLDNGYSVHVGLRTYHIRNTGIIQTRITIYKDGKNEVEAIKTHLLSNSNISHDQPFIRINNRPIVSFDKEHFEKTGEWRYHVTLAINHHEIDLFFTGTSKGWKIETSDNCWAVPLPKAKVTGAITVNNKKMQVKGIGYHDHNWGYSPATAVKYQGWYWGRITGETLNLTWAKIMQTKEKGDVLAVINQDTSDSIKRSNFYSIPPSNISFTQKNFEQSHRQMIPKSFSLKITDKITDKHTPIDIDINMKTIDTHHTRIFTIHYWRYHITATGNIIVGSKKENIEKIPQIIEFLSFKQHGEINE